MTTAKFLAAFAITFAAMFYVAPDDGRPKEKMLLCVVSALVLALSSIVL
jgi:hypothetical protein